MLIIGNNIPLKLRQNIPLAKRLTKFLIHSKEIYLKSHAHIRLPQSLVEHSIKIHLVSPSYLYLYFDQWIEYISPEPAAVLLAEWQLKERVSLEEI